MGRYSSWSLRARFLLATSLLTLVLCSVFAFAVHQFIELLEDELLHRTLVREVQQLKTELSENSNATPAFLERIERVRRARVPMTGRPCPPS